MLCSTHYLKQNPETSETAYLNTAGNAFLNPVANKSDITIETIAM